MKRVRCVVAFLLALASACDRSADDVALVDASADSTGPVDLASPGGRGSWFGTSAASAGDINGDGYGDFGIGASAVIDLMAPGAAYLFLGSATLDGAGWSGESPSMRRDLLGPDGSGSHFGNSIAGG